MKLKKRVYVIIGLVLGIVGLLSLMFVMNTPLIEFYNKVEKIEINSEYNAYSFIKKISGYEKEDIQIDTSKVDVKELGTNEIIYRIKDKDYSLKVEIVDTVAPQYDVNNLDIDLGMQVSLDDIIENIKDETKTKSYFKETYEFTKEGEQDIIVVVEDEAGNKTEKSVHVKIVKDDEKPILSGLKDFTVYQNQKIDYLNKVTAKDNRDPKPQVNVNSSQVDLTKVGTYPVEYTVKDRSGNMNTYTNQVNVMKKKNTTIPASGHKTVYLTFDDGPSANTAKVLDVLAKYNAKATFFVTGNGQSYNYLIKRAHQEGHTIGLHTYSHNYAKLYASVDAYFNDLDKIGQMVKGQIGFVPKYIRFPGGGSNTISKKYCSGIMSVLTSEVQNRGYQYYDWNASTGDANGNNIAVSTLVKEATSVHSHNVMILAHDTQAKSTTIQALPQIIEHYQALGYSFKAIDDQSFTPHHRVNN